MALAAWVRHARASDSSLFTLGVASGWPTASSVVLWTRLLPASAEAAQPLGAVAVRWELAEDEGLTQGQRSGEVVARPADAHRVHVELSGLPSARLLWYRFTALGQRSAVGCTRTAPLANSLPASLTLAVAGCQRLDHGHYAAWRDEVEHMPAPLTLKPDARGRGRLHGRLDWGRLARVQWLGMRQHRDPQACPRSGMAGSNVVRAAECPALLDPQRSLIGSAQEAWLAHGWSTQHPWNLLLQSTLMARASHEQVLRPPSQSDQSSNFWRYCTDGWDGYPACRDPVLATAFCGTSIGSHGVRQATVDNLLRHNPQLRYGRADRRGSVILRLSAQRLEADLRAAANAEDPRSAVSSAHRFTVVPERPGLNTA